MRIAGRGQADAVKIASVQLAGVRRPTQRDDGMSDFGPVVNPCARWVSHWIELVGDGMPVATWRG